MESVIDFECLRGILENIPDIEITSNRRVLPNREYSTRDEYVTVIAVSGSRISSLMVCYEKNRRPIAGGFLYLDVLEKIQRFLMQIQESSAADRVSECCKPISDLVT